MACALYLRPALARGTRVLSRCSPSTSRFSRALPTTAASSKAYSTTTTQGPVDLSYSSVIPSNGNDTEGAFVMIHGLFGNKRNFASLQKAFQRDLDRPVYALDLRNHGVSPHASPMTYEAMADDVLEFIEKKKLTNFSLMGHSMGGKVAMSLALGPHAPKELSNLIVVDIAPVRASMSPSFVTYCNAMLEVEDPAKNIQTRDQANKYLADIEPDTAVRQFLLTNLVTPNSSEPERTTIKWQIPVSLLRDSMDKLGYFTFGPEDGRTWNGRTLVIKGARSKFINRHNLPLFEKFFPNAKYEMLDTEHWVHAEKPHEFKKLIVDFIQQN